MMDVVASLTSGKHELKNIDDRLDPSRLCLASARPEVVQHVDGCSAFSAVLSTEGRVVGLCWAKLKPKGPKASHGDDESFADYLS